MEVEDVSQLLLTFWRAHHADPRPPATAGAVQAFERRYAVRLPDDLRSVLAMSNGTNAMDARSLIAFWRVEDYEPQRPGLFGFADYLIDSARYAVALSADPRAPTPVLTNFGGRNDDWHQIAESFAAFIRLYTGTDELAVYG
jgi:cell wall assembly regulator SMI1